MFGGQSAAEKEEAARGGNVRDVDAYFKQVQSVIKRYRRVVEKLELIKKDKKKALERMELIAERGKLKDEFIAKKQAARANIKMLKGGLDVLKERELRVRKRAHARARARACVGGARTDGRTQPGAAVCALRGDSLAVSTRRLMSHGSARGAFAASAAPIPTLGGAPALELRARTRAAALATRSSAAHQFASTPQSAAAADLSCSLGLPKTFVLRARAQEGSPGGVP